MSRKYSKKIKLGVTQCLVVLGIITFSAGLGINLLLYHIVLAEGGSGNVASGSNSASTEITVNINDAISIRTLEKTASTEISKLDLELIPTPRGRFVKNTTQVDVSTTNSTGYKLYMASSYPNPHTSTTENPVYTTNMIHANADVADTVSNLSSIDVAEGTFSAQYSNPYLDQWGYSLSEYDVAGIYNPLPEYNSAILIRGDVASAVEHSYTPVTIGADVDTNIVAGTYTNNLMFSAIANPPYVDYSLIFNANTDGAGGDDKSATNLPDDITERVMATSYSISVPDNIPTRENHVFRGWNTKPDGTGMSYVAGDKYSFSIEDGPNPDIANVTGRLYATWAGQYDVALDQQDGAGGTNSISAIYGEALPNITVPSRTGYKFAGYYAATSGDGTQYYDADGLGIRNWDIEHATTLYAKWTANTYYIKFNGNGSTSGSMDVQEFKYGTAKNLSTNTYTKTGRNFVCWHTKSDNTGTVYHNGQSIDSLTATDGETINLYATWTSIPVLTAANTYFMHTKEENRSFVKVYAGNAFAAQCRTAQGFYGPLLVSTDSAAVAYKAAGVQWNYLGSLSYAGLTYYYSNNEYWTTSANNLGTYSLKLYSSSSTNKAAVVDCATRLLNDVYSGY